MTHKSNNGAQMAHKKCFVASVRKMTHHYIEAKIKQEQTTEKKAFHRLKTPYSFVIRFDFI